MITLILKSYMGTLLTIGIGCFVLFLLGLYWIFKNDSHPPDVITDFSTIAGEDIIATQLDLARAYIETNNKPMAKNILKTVIYQGNPSQKEEARSLLGLI